MKDAPLSKMAVRIVLEVTERASLYGVKNIGDSVAKLKRLGFQIAIDDLGAGYAGLTSITQLEPEVAKIDMSLVRGVDTDPRRQSIIRSAAKLCDELGMMVVFRFDVREQRLFRRWDDGSSIRAWIWAYEILFSPPLSAGLRGRHRSSSR